MSDAFAFFSHSVVIEFGAGFPPSGHHDDDDHDDEDANENENDDDDDDANDPNNANAMNKKI